MAAEPVLDPHFHIWDLEAHTYPWLTERPQRLLFAGSFDPISKSYRIEDYHADSARQNVVKAVHVDAGWRYDDPVGETRWLEEVAECTGWPHGIVARAELDQPDIGQLLDAHGKCPLLRGVRHIANWHPDPEKSYISRSDLLTDKGFERGFAALGERGLSFDLQIYPAQMRDAAALAGRHPDVPVILNHVGMPIDRDPENLALWRDGLRRLAELPQVSIKLSGLGMIDWHWTVDSIRPFIREAITVFGPDRAMFASNFPVDRLYSTFDALFDAFKAVVEDLPEIDRSKLFNGTAARVYRL